jgi:molybdopterin synthase catalytic subunit
VTDATTGDAVVRLAAISERELSVDAVLAAVSDHAAGGTVVFVGTVRDRDDGHAVAGLAYSAHPSAAEQLRAVAESVASSYPAVALAAVHRVGTLDVGDLAVVVAAACPHRGEAFAAGQTLIDRVKAEVPIWKHQQFADGTEEWVGLST